MPERRLHWTRRSGLEWSVRAVLAVIALIAGYMSVAQTLASAWRTRDPEFAHVLAPNDGRVSAQLAQTLIGADATGADRARADKLARSALAKDPTSVVAASVLGMNAQIRGDTTGARRLMTYAEMLSRRNVAVQLWAIEDAVGRGDVVEALRHYDMALRTSRAAPDLLFPVLSSAVKDPTIRPALVRLLASRPNWGSSFVDYVSTTGSDPHTTAVLLRDLDRVGYPLSEGAKAATIGGLAAAGDMDAAWSYYASIRLGTDRRRSRDPRFTVRVGTPTPFDWTPINEAGIITSIQADEEGGAFDFSAPASVGGTLLKQMQLLPPGNYRLAGHSNGIDQAEEALPYWVLNCQSGRELGRIIVPNSNKNGGNFSGNFKVPSGCPVQTLELIAQPSGAVSGSMGRIDRSELTPE